MPIVVWEPPHRIRFGAAEGAPGRAHDIHVSVGTEGGSVVRLVDDGVDDDAASATAQGWDTMLRRLQEQAAAL
jgi:hypothetical protein